MYLSERKPSPIDMVIEVNSATTTIDHHNQVIIGDNNNSSGGEEQDMRALPKKRAETWAQEETRNLISLRREIDGFFNTSKSNKHLWDQISSKMRERGFDRSPTMCTDKWRNLLKEFKKVKHHHHHAGGAANKMLYYKELEELLRSRPKNVNGAACKSPAAPLKADSFVRFSDKGLDDCSIPYGSVEAGGRSTVNLERPLDNDSDPLAITTADAVVASGLPPWNWRETPANGAEGQFAYVGRVITVKWGEYTRRFGIDATTDTIKEAIKSVFGLRTKRAFWLEDDDNIIRPLDRDMPLGNYTLHLDEGVSMKIFYDESDPIPVRTEDKNLYTEEDFRSFLARRGLIGLRELNDYRCCFNVDELRPGAVYQAVRLLGD